MQSNVQRENVNDCRNHRAELLSIRDLPTVGERRKALKELVFDYADDAIWAEAKAGRGKMNRGKVPILTLRGSPRTLLAMLCDVWFNVEDDAKRAKRDRFRLRSNEIGSWPHYRLYAKYLGWSVDTVRRNLQILKRLGVVSIRPWVESDGNRGSNTIVLMLDHLLRLERVGGDGAATWEWEMYGYEDPFADPDDDEEDDDEDEDDSTQPEPTRTEAPGPRNEPAGGGNLQGGSLQIVTPSEEDLNPDLKSIEGKQKPLAREFSEFSEPERDSGSARSGPGPVRGYSTANTPSRHLPAPAPEPQLIRKQALGRIRFAQQRGRAMDGRVLRWLESEEGQLALREEALERADSS